MVLCHESPGLYKDHLVISAWHDSGIAMAISNVHPYFSVTVECCTEGRADLIMLPEPLILAEYNSWMGAIDNVARYCLFKWWHAIFTFLVGIAAINALHLWCLENPEEAQLTTLQTWMAGLIEEILGTYGDCFKTPWGKEPQCAADDWDHDDCQ
jgi:hypothetical protein